MQMTSVQALITILAIAVGTQFTRWLPFWLFPEKKDPPKKTEADDGQISLGDLSSFGEAA